MFSRLLPDNIAVTPPDPSGTNSDGSSAVPDQSVSSYDVPKTAHLRPFTIDVPIPRHPRRKRHVQIEIQDVTGQNLVYDEYQDPGEKASVPLQGFGNKITFRIFLDSKLVRQETL